MNWTDKRSKETGQRNSPKLASVLLPDNGVDIWCARLPNVWDSGLSQAYRNILTEEERNRYAGFTFEKDRCQFLLTRALVRDVLSRYTGVEPFDLVFTRNRYGKPALAEPSGCPIAFNLSHTKGVSVCAVAPGQMIGVDVESLGRTIRHSDIAKRFFASSEVAFLDRFEGDQKRIEFFRLWTLKEAFVKARGLGLSIPLDSFVIEISPNRPLRLSFSDKTTGHETDWRFMEIRLGSSFQIGIALFMAEPKEVVVRFSAITPLAGAGTLLSLPSNRLNGWVLNGV